MKWSDLPSQIQGFSRLTGLAGSGRAEVQRFIFVAVAVVGVLAVVVVAAAVGVPAPDASAAPGPYALVLSAVAVASAPVPVVFAAPDSRGAVVAGDALALFDAAALASCARRFSAVAAVYSQARAFADLVSGVPVALVGLAVGDAPVPAVSGATVP